MSMANVSGLCTGKNSLLETRVLCPLICNVVLSMLSFSGTPFYYQDLDILSCIKGRPFTFNLKAGHNLLLVFSYVTFEITPLLSLL